MSVSSQPILPDLDCWF